MNYTEQDLAYQIVIKSLILRFKTANDKVKQAIDDMNESLHTLLDSCDNNTTKVSQPNTPKHTKARDKPIQHPYKPGDTYTPNNKILNRKRTITKIDDNNITYKCDGINGPLDNTIPIISFDKWVKLSDARKE